MKTRSTARTAQLVCFMCHKRYLVEGSRVRWSQREGLRHSFCSATCYHLWRARRDERRYGPTRRRILSVAALGEKTLKEIAAEEHLSLERVRQIVRRAGSSYRRRRSCPGCGGRISPRATLCRRCRTSPRFASLTCSECGRTFDRPESLAARNERLGYRHTFCCKRCQGRWAARSFGFQKGEAHPRKSRKAPIEPRSDARPALRTQTREDG